MQLKEMAERLDEVSFEMFCTSMWRQINKGIKVGQMLGDATYFENYVRNGITASEKDMNLVNPKYIIDALNRYISQAPPVVAQAPLSKEAINNIQTKQGPKALQEPAPSSVWKTQAIQPSLA
jgi:hypothetical protein